MTLVSLATIATTDFSSITRGRTIDATKLEAHSERGVGWLQANLSLLPNGRIASPNPWGSRGDLRLVPDLSSRFRTDRTGAATPFDLVLGDILELDGTPWPGCTRGMLRTALADLRTLHGVGMNVAFEHEFQIFGMPAERAHPLSFAALRSADPLGPRLIAALEEAGVEPEVFIAEFGHRQFEITCMPADAMVAADRAIAIREITREIARHFGWQASFSPKTAVDSVGNGLHIHFSFVDGQGRPVTYDSDGQGGLSSFAGAFCAGVLDHMPALLAITAPSPVSYLRLQPGSWSASYRWIAVQDREASLRICPLVSLGESDPGPQFNIEYRPADALSNPYLSLAAIIRAGMDGVSRALKLPPFSPTHPEEMDAAARPDRLPQSLPEALAAFEGNALIRDWMAPEIHDCFLGVRQAEIGATKGMDDEALCGHYRELY